MRIINAMFGRGLGGIEQSFIDYTKALAGEGSAVTVIIHPNAAIKPELEKIYGITIYEIKNSGQWDFIAALRLRSFMKKLKPDIAIAHGNRAISLLKRGAKNVCPIVGVAHNYKIKRLVGLDGVFTITNDLRNKVIGLGQDESRVFIVPNMIAVREKAKGISFNPPPLEGGARGGVHEENLSSKHPVIGTMGRFVKKKGFESFIRAMALLKDDSVDFRVIIGGDGEKNTALQQLVTELNLEEKIDFTGWVEDKSAFFDSIDIFCLPSLHEPFGIVLIEAFAYGIPVVTTDSEGPSEIATDEKDALIVAKNNPKAMASAINRLIMNSDFAEELSANALQTVKNNYEISIVGKRIQQALKSIQNF